MTPSSDLPPWQHTPAASAEEQPVESTTQFPAVADDTDDEVLSDSSPPTAAAAWLVFSRGPRAGDPPRRDMTHSPATGPGTSPRRGLSRSTAMSVSSPSPSVSASLVDAALQCFVTFGVRKTSLTDVANHAYVSRTSTYRAFGDKDGLVRTVVTVEVHRFVTALDDTVDWRQPLEQALEQAVEFTLGYLRQHPLLQRVLTREPEQLTHVVIGQHEPATLIDLILPAVVDRFAQTHHDLLRVPTEQVAEWLIRIVVSLLLNPSTRMPDPHTVATLLLHGVITDPTGG